MKVLVDEMDDGWDDKLSLAGYEAESVRKLRMQGHPLADDYSVIKYAQKNDMTLITRDKRCGKNCEVAGVRCILLDNDELFKIVLERLKAYDGPAE